MYLFWFQSISQFSIRCREEYLSVLHVPPTLYCASVQSVQKWRKLWLFSCYTVVMPAAAC